MTQTRQVSWPGWEVVQPIGSGSFGTVYEIRREIFGREEHAALKVITIPRERDEIDELYREGYDQASITDHIRGYLEDIVREYSLMMEIKGHTNVVCCDDLRYVQHDDGIGWDIYIKMELLTPLSRALDKTYSEQATIKLGMDLCNALALCRQENIVHRDIKPANIFISKSGHYKLGDFGVAKVAEKTVSGTKIGTYDYMAPEIYNCRPYGTASDMYSLGLVLYWMMNDRRTPFLPDPSRIPTADEKETARRRRFNGEPLPPPAHGSHALKQIVLKACAFDPAHRYADPQQMRQALAALADMSLPPEQIFPPVNDQKGDPRYQHQNPPVQPVYPQNQPHRPPVQQGYPQKQPYRPPVPQGYPQKQPYRPPVPQGHSQNQPYRPPVQQGYPQNQPYRPPVQQGYPQNQPYRPPVQQGYPQNQPYRPPVQQGYPQNQPYRPPVQQGYPQDQPYRPPVQQGYPQDQPQQPAAPTQPEPDENGIIWQTPGDL